MNPILSAWNADPEQTAIDSMLACCGATRWAAAMVAARPIPTPESLHHTDETIWSQMSEADWLEAFACHPRIGSCKSATHASHQAATWSKQEQSSTQTAAEQTLSH